jgi:hypothetical protein
VQRSDEDPLLWNITYRGDHSCVEPGEHLPPVLPEPQRSPSPLGLWTNADEESVATTSGVGSSSITSVATQESQITWTPTLAGSLQVMTAEHR